MSDEARTSNPAISARPAREARAELVRIDAQGVAHPIGNTASQRMRAREGAFRILPAPGHVVLMRFTGEDGRRDAEDGAVVRLSGEITAPGTMCDILALLGQSGWKGELVVLDGESARSIFIDQGNVVGAQTSVDDERLGMVLYRYGAINAEQHELIMEKVNEGSRFGQSAVDLGIMNQEKLFQYIGKQLDEIVFATFAIADGTFFFLDGFDETRLVFRHTVSAGALLMDGVTRLDEIRFFRQKIPSEEYVPAHTEKGEPDEEFRATWARVDGKTSIEELGRLTGRGDFDTTKDIFAMLQSKHVVLHPPRMTGGAPGVVGQANVALLTIHQRADAGGKGTVVRESLAQFATGAGVYDILFRSAGPDERGALDIEQVVQNAELVAAGHDPENVLKQMLHEYVAFALFSAGGALGAEGETKLTEDVDPILKRILPTG